MCQVGSLTVAISLSVIGGKRMMHTLKAAAGGGFDTSIV